MVILGRIFLFRLDLMWIGVVGQKCRWGWSTIGLSHEASIGAPTAFARILLRSPRSTECLFQERLACFMSVGAEEKNKTFTSFLTSLFQDGIPPRGLATLPVPSTQHKHSPQLLLPNSSA